MTFAKVNELVTRKQDRHAEEQPLPGIQRQEVDPAER
jgi:hypothetical protein